MSIVGGSSGRLAGLSRRPAAIVYSGSAGSSFLSEPANKARSFRSLHGSLLVEIVNQK